jgi:hypothetical protein
MWALVSAVSQDSEEEEDSEQVDSEAEVELASSWKMKTAAHPVFIFASHSQTQNPKPLVQIQPRQPAAPTLRNSQYAQKIEKNPNPQTPSTITHLLFPGSSSPKPPKPNQNQVKRNLQSSSSSFSSSNILHHIALRVQCHPPLFIPYLGTRTMQAVSNFGALERCECGWAQQQQQKQQQESWSWSRFQGVYFLPYLHTYIQKWKGQYWTHHSGVVVEKKGREGKEAGREVVRDGRPRGREESRVSIGGHQGKGGGPPSKRPWIAIATGALRKGI